MRFLSRLVLAFLCMTASVHGQTLLYEVTLPEVLEGAALEDGLASVGDINGDGHPDFSIIQDRVHVLLFSGVDGSLLLAISPEDVGLIEEAMSMGDTTGDGVPDIALRTGANVIGIDGASGTELYRVPAGSPPNAGSIYVGTESTMAGIGDANGDRIPDIAVSQQGAVLLLSGDDGSVLPEVETDVEVGLLAAVSDVDQRGVLDLFTLAPFDSFPTFRFYTTSTEVGDTLVTMDATWSWTAEPYIVASIGDLDADSVKEVAIGTVEKFASFGIVQVFDGATGEQLWFSTADEADPGNRESFLFGSTVDGDYDLGGDAQVDVVVGAADRFAFGEPAYQGRVFALNGGDGTVLYSLTSPHPQEEGFFGQQVLSPGDVNGDGAADIVVLARGEVREDGGTGRIYAFSGASEVANEPKDRPSATLSASVYPNPATSSTTLAYTLRRTTMVRADLVDALGRVRWRNRVGTQGAGSHRLSVPTERLPIGVYVLRLQTEDEQVVRRVTVAR